MNSKPFMAIALVVCFFFIWDCSGDSKGGPEEIVRNYVKAHNSGNVKERLTFFDKNTELETAGSDGTLSGLHALVATARYDSALQSKLTISNLRTEGNTVICKMEETNRLLEIAEFGQLKYDSVLFYVLNGKIRKLIAYPDSAISANYQAMMNSFFTWLLTTYPSRVAPMIRAGEIQPTPENADRLQDFLAEWIAIDTMQTPSE